MFLSAQCLQQDDRQRSLTAWRHLPVVLFAVHGQDFLDLLSEHGSKGLPTSGTPCCAAHGAAGMEVFVGCGLGSA